MEQALRDKLKELTDHTSILIRFFPDRVYVGDKSFLCEIKTTDQMTSNYAIELDSYRAASALGKVIYIFVDITNDKVERLQWCKSEAIKPERIRVPSRYEFEKKKDELIVDFPDCGFIPMAWK